MSQILADLLVLIYDTLEVLELLSGAAVSRSWCYTYKLGHRLDVSPLFRGLCLAYSATATAMPTWPPCTASPMTSATT